MSKKAKKVKVVEPELTPEEKIARKRAVAKARMERMYEKCRKRFDLGISRTQQRHSLYNALQDKDPVERRMQDRKIINWPMKEFRHQLFLLADNKVFPTAKAIRFSFDIEKKLTTANLFFEDRNIWLTYDYQNNDNVHIKVDGNDGVVEDDVTVKQMADYIGKYGPKTEPKKVVVKTAVVGNTTTTVTPKKKIVVVRRKVAPKA